MVESSQRTLSQVGLLQVLLMLPFDILRNSLLKHLSLIDKQYFRASCKQACQLVGDLAGTLCLNITDATDFAAVTAWFRKFTSVQLVKFDIHRQGQDWYNQFVHCLFQSRTNLASVTRIQYTGTLPFILSYPVSTIFPLLAELVLDGNCDRTPTFAALTSLTSLCWRPKGVNTITDLSGDISTAFGLPNLVQLTVDTKDMVMLVWESPALRNNSSCFHTSAVTSLYLPNLLFGSSDAAALSQLPHLQVLQVGLITPQNAIAPGSFAKMLKLTQFRARWVDPNDVLVFLPQPSLQYFHVKSLQIDHRWASVAGKALEQLLSLKLGSPEETLAPTLLLYDIQVDVAVASLQSWPVLPRWTRCDIRTTEPLSAAFVQQLYSRVPDLEHLHISAAPLPVSVPLLHQAVQTWPSLEVLQLSLGSPLTVTHVTALAVACGSRHVRILVEKRMYDACQQENINEMLDGLQVRSRVYLYQP